MCRWCGLGDHDDRSCPKSRINLLTIEKSNERETLTITRAQTKKATYLDPHTEKEQVWEAKANIE